MSENKGFQQCFLFPRSQQFSRVTQRVPCQHCCWKLWLCPDDLSNQHYKHQSPNPIYQLWRNKEQSGKFTLKVVKCTMNPKIFIPLQTRASSHFLCRFICQSSNVYQYQRPEQREPVLRLCSKLFNIVHPHTVKDKETDWWSLTLEGFLNNGELKRLTRSQSDKRSRRKLWILSESKIIPILLTTALTDYLVSNNGFFHTV